ncbi:GOLPH3/VPS74 family protein [Salimicrobium flavidum]|uniref:Golgi phosphoprotein 3 (GPP34) n=1 Tax=Salimicrobium flavidum TaxID=570947 RepID=A0A1N7IRY6_9BACI|nr:GPP34 family phosphoprotein [Salimicrobium flavidum]SIS39787.1 Golgi phosphoprotein 3 (GPP34) [Salimicrobium flavidum]
MFTIADELLLLALHNKKGSVVSRATSSLNFGLAGAFISELALKERVEVNGKRLVVKDSTPVEDPFLNDIFEQIKNSKKNRKIRTWVEKFGHRMKDRRKGMSHRLAEQGILEEKQKDFLGVFKWNIYPSRDYSYEQEIRTRLTEALKTPESLDDRTLVLLSLIGACDIVKEVFPKEEAKEKKKQIKQWTKQNPYGKAVNDTVHATNNAVYAAIGAAAIASSGPS